MSDDVVNKDERGKGEREKEAAKEVCRLRTHSKRPSKLSSGLFPTTGSIVSRRM